MKNLPTEVIATNFKKLKINLFKLVVHILCQKICHFESQSARRLNYKQFLDVTLSEAVIQLENKLPSVQCKSLHEENKHV